MRTVHKIDVIHGDVMTREASEEKEVDLYVWTPPCQSFSTAGLRGGISDARGRLLFAGLRYVRRTEPRLAIMENVKGLRSKKKQTSASEGRTSF